MDIETYNILFMNYGPESMGSFSRTGESFFPFSTASKPVIGLI
jgi:hypothetical protein